MSRQRHMIYPKVILKCAANYPHHVRKRIIEFNSNCGGGLISFRETEYGRLIVEVYCTDPSVVVRGTTEEKVTEALRRGVGV